MDTPIVNEKRLSSRAEVKWPVVLMTSHGATVAETKNIGASGAFILCHAQLRPKEKVKAFVMAPNRKSLNISGEVAWSNPLSTEEDSPLVELVSGLPASLPLTASIFVTLLLNIMEARNKDWRQKSKN